MTVLRMDKGKRGKFRQMTPFIQLRKDPSVYIRTYSIIQ